MTEKENEIRTQRLEIAGRRLSQRGYEPVDFDFSGTMASDEEFGYTITQVREGFDRARKDLQPGKKVSEEEAGKIRTSVGEAVNIVDAAAGDLDGPPTARVSPPIAGARAPAGRSSRARNWT
jgi:hypothetical protein